MTDRLVKMLSTFFYIGKFPLAPGSAASLAGALLGVIFNQVWFLYLILFAAVTIAGFKVSGRMEEIMGEKDPGCVVIDEVSGILIAFFLLPMNWATFWIAFFLFRAFDMFKIYPANIFEQKGGAYGIMMDDVMAGIYTFAVMQIAVRLVGMI